MSCRVREARRSLREQKRSEVLEVQRREQRYNGESEAEAAN